MLNRIWNWLKARWVWGKGDCPACGRRFFGATAVYNCEVCKGANDDLTIWTRWRHWKPQPPVPSAKVLHKHTAKVIWKNKIKDAVVEKETS